MKKLLFAMMLSVALLGFTAQVFAQMTDSGEEENVTEYQFEMDEDVSAPTNKQVEDDYTTGEDDSTDYSSDDSDYEDDSE